MPTISINIEDIEKDILNKRAKKNLMTLREQIEDIVRRSCIRTKEGKKYSINCDDKLVGIFSREKKGRKKKTKKKKN